jgi:hypothetical protein
VAMGRILLNPFNRTLQSELLRKVGGEQSLHHYLSSVTGFDEAYHNCTRMLFNSDIGLAIERPLLLLNQYRMQNIVNNFQMIPVVACLNCFEYGPKGEFEKSHKCFDKEKEASYGSLTHPTFRAYEDDIKKKLTEPQKALLLFCPPCETTHLKSETNYYGNNVMAYGPPGVGKTFVLSLIVIAHMKKFGWNSIIVACEVGSSGSYIPIHTI